MVARSTTEPCVAATPPSTLTVTDVSLVVAAVAASLLSSVCWRLSLTADVPGVTAVADYGVSDTDCQSELTLSWGMHCCCCCLLLQRP